MRYNVRKKGNGLSYRLGQAVQKINVPSFKFDKIKDYDRMYEEAFELGQKSFEDQFKKPHRKTKKENTESSKFPTTAIKGEECLSQNRSTKL